MDGEGSGGFMDSNMSNESSTCSWYTVLYVDPEETAEVGSNLMSNSYTPENISEAVFELGNDSRSSVYSFPAVLQDDTDARSERLHFLDSGALLLIMALLFLTIITIWVFKVRRFRVLHETGLAIIYGILVGVLLRFGIGSFEYNEYTLARPFNSTEQCPKNMTFQVGQTIRLNTNKTGGDVFLCAIEGKVFQNQNGNYLRSQLQFDPEIFFFALLPPIIFYAGFSLKKRHFFRNLGSLLLYAFSGTTVSCFIIGGLMYGYAVSGAEAEGSTFANLTGRPVPEDFRESIIPSLLFGSLISATDPVTVLAIFHDLHVDHDVFSLVFGESVMNDAVAIVLFRSIDEYAPTSGSDGEEGGFEWTALLKSIGSFVGIFLGSFLLGCAMGLLTALLMKFSKLRDYPLLESSMFVIMSYTTFLFAEFTQLTGIVAVLFCGIMQSYYTYINLSIESRRRTKELFELVNFLAENFVFSYMGLSLFTFTNHQWVPGFILFSFVAIFAGRVVNIYVNSFLLNLGRGKKISFRFQHMLLFAGLRGAIAFALAIRNTQSEHRQLIFTTTLCIVLVTVLFCGGLTTLMLQFLRIPVGVEDDTGGLQEEGQLIDYDKKKGNWLISKFTLFDKRFLLPIFTHHGRPVTEFCKHCPHWCIPFCNKCRPQDELLLEEESEPGSSEGDSELSDELDEDQVLSFRQSHDFDDNEDNIEETEEGDLGLGSDVGDGSRAYRPLLPQSEESEL